MEVVIVLDDKIDIKESFDNKYLIGVERGCLLLINKRYPFTAIGDFDSVSTTEFLEISQKAKKLIKHSEKKDLTDTQLAVNLASQISEKITIYGGIKGPRIEHFLANVNLFIDYPSLRIIDNDSVIFSITKNTEFKKDNYRYISFFALKEINELTLKGFKYPLNKYNLKPYDSICISNELIDIGEVILSNGHLLVIKSN